MPNIEITVWILTGVVSLIAILVGVIWKLIRQEAREQAEAIKRKADTERVLEVEKRWEQQLTSVKVDNDKLLTKLETRHDKEMDQLSQRLSEAIHNSEANILAQIKLMIHMIDRAS